MISFLSRWLSNKSNSGLTFGDLNGTNPRFFITGGTWIDMGEKWGGRSITLYWHRHKGSHQWVFVEGRPVKHSFTERPERIQKAPKIG